MTVTPTRLPWHLTYHAEQQMAERGIGAQELAELLTFPKYRNSASGDRTRLSGNGILAVVHEEDHVVITVGIEGADKADWMEKAVERARSLPTGSDEDMTALNVLIERQRTAGRQPRKRPQYKPAPVQTRNVLDGVAPGLRSAIIKQCDGDLRRVEVLSRSRVVIKPAAP